MAKLLTDAQTPAYRRDGYLCPLIALTPAEAARYRARLEAPATCANSAWRS